MKTILLLISVLLTGCEGMVPDTIEIEHIFTVDQCKDHDGMYTLDIQANTLVCGDGAEFSIYKGEL